jgi:hypothetical protein
MSLLKTQGCPPLTRRIPFCEIRAALITNNSSAASAARFTRRSSAGRRCGARGSRMLIFAFVEGLRRGLGPDILPAPLEGWH